MAERPVVLSAEEMARKYGELYQRRPRVRLDRGRIPESVWSLIPYAEFWGVSDDLDREHLVDNAPHAVQQNLKDVIAFYDDDLDIWLAGSEARDPNPSDEYVAFSAMRMAADYV